MDGRCTAVCGRSKAIRTTLPFEHPIAEFIDDLLSLDDREGFGGGLVTMGFSANEVMFLNLAVLKGFADDAGGQPAAAIITRRRANAEPFVGDCLRLRPVAVVAAE